MGPAKRVKADTHLPGPRVTEIEQSKARGEGGTTCYLMAHRMRNGVL